MKRRRWRFGMLSAALHGGMPNISGFRSSPFPVMPDRAAENLRREGSSYLAEKGATLDPATEETFLYYKNLKNSDSEKEDKN